MPLQNDSKRWLQMAPESSTWGVAPAYVLTIAGSGGTFALTWNGLTTAAIAYNAIPSAVVSALAALSGFGASTNVVATGTLAAGLTLTFVGWRGAAGLTADFALITGGGSNTITGGPVWTVMKISKCSHKPKLNIEFAEEIRNAPDMLYQDSVMAGGAVEDWEIDFKLRCEQLPIFFEASGFTDVKTTHSGETVVYDHTMKPGAGSPYGKSYSVMMYDGQRAYLSMGVIGTDLGIKGTASESGKFEGTFKGWGGKAYSVAVPTISLPSNTTYRMIKPTNSGVAVTLNGSTNYAYLIEFDFKWKRDAKPLFTQQGTTEPYRAEYGKRQVDLTTKILFDDPTEYDQALTVAPPNRSIVFILPHLETVGTVPTAPSVTITVPRFFYKDPAIDTSGAATVATFSAQAVYDTASAAQVSVVIVNEVSAAY